MKRKWVGFVVMEDMKVRKIAILFVVSLGIVGFCATAYGGGKKRYLVTVRGKLGNAVEKAGGKVLHKYHVVRGLSVEVPEAAVGALKRNANVVSVRPDVVVQVVLSAKKPSKPPKGGGGKKQTAEVLEWNVDHIDAELAWASTTGAGVNVAVIDTGIDDDHPDLAGNIGGGVNFVVKGRKLDPTKWADDNGHGTHVAGIIAAVDNEIGVIGVAPEATVHAVKVLDGRGNGWLSDVVAGIEWSIDNNMAVINMSLGASEGDPLLSAACESASDAGILVVAAAGNDGGAVLYPARYDSVIAVGATDADDNVPSWSNQGEEVELVAPGVNVRSTWKGGGYKTESGTSMATPHVAGVCALMLGLDPLAIPDDPRTQLENSANDLDPVGRDETSGFGVVDAEKAVTGD